MNCVTHPLNSADISIFYRKSSNFAILENTILIAFWYIISNYFDFFWVFKDLFDKHGYNFVDVSKIGYSRSS